MLFDVACKCEISVLLLQETWLKSDPMTWSPCPIPSGWICLFSPPPQPDTRDLGLGILVRRDILRNPNYAHFRHVHYHGTQSFQALTARLGPWILSSVYVFCGYTSPDYDSLAAYIDTILPHPAHTTHIMAGDFNYPQHTDHLIHKLMAVGMSPLILPGPGQYTRTGRAAGASSSLLDNIFTTDTTLVTSMATEEVGFSDHRLLLCDSMQPSRTDAGPHATAPHLRPFIDWRPLISGDESAIQKVQLAIEGMPAHLDLAAINDYLLNHAASILGTRQPHNHFRNPWMSDPYVRKLLAIYHEARECHTIIHSEDSKSFLRQVQRQFEKARDRAINAAHFSLSSKVFHGEVSVFKALDRVRPRPSYHRYNPYIDPTEAQSFWRTIFTGEPRCQPPAAGRCYTTHITKTITAEDVTHALALMKPKAPGPDKLPFHILRRYTKWLAPHLARACTQALRGIPDALRIAETLLLPKTTPPSSDPQDYRPITLLPMLVRLFHKLIDNKLRAELFGDTREPYAARVNNCKLLTPQAGFQKGRSTYDHAFLLHLLLNAQHSRQSNNCLYAAFMDIHKAFDSLDHEHLLHMMEHNLHLDKEWLEIISRLLSHNTTTILGYSIAITIGAFQGSPLSPLFCLIYMDDLARDLLAFLEAFPLQSPLTFPQVPGLQRHQLLLLLLLFADDVLALGLTPVELQRLATRIGEWAERRGLKISKKSFTAVLAGSHEVPSPLPPLTSQHITMTWHPESFAYLGIPFRVYHPHWHSDAAFPIDTASLQPSLNAARAMCFSATGARVIHIPALVTTLNQTVIQKALYAATVIDIHYHTLDSLIYDTLRSLLQLPKCTPTVLVFWELRIRPSHLIAYKRALRYIARFVHHSPVYYQVIRPLLTHRPPGASKALFARGPLKRLLRILDHREGDSRTIGDMLLPSLHDPYAVLHLIGQEDIHEWYKRVDTTMDECYRAWVKHKINTSHASYKTQLRAGLDINAPLSRRPSYISVGGDRARAGLRFKVPFLRYYHDRAQPIHQCAWCGMANSESGLHLLSCPRQPTPVRDTIDNVTAITRPECDRRLLRSPEALLKAIYRLRWSPRQSSLTTMAVLEMMTSVVNCYRQAVLVPVGQNHPISPIRTITLAVCDVCRHSITSLEGCRCQDQEGTRGGGSQEESRQGGSSRPAVERGSAENCVGDRENDTGMNVVALVSEGSSSSQLRT